MRPLLNSDSARQHRIAAVFALAFAVAAVLSVSGVFALDFGPTRIAPLILFELIPDAWSAHWLRNALPAASQQSAAAQQWLHVLLVFCAAAAVFALINAFIGLLAHANDRRYENAVRGLIGAAPRTLSRGQMKAASVNALLGIAAGAPFGVVLALLLRSTWRGELRSAGAPYIWLAIAAIACLYVAVLAARTASSRFHQSGWLGDALAPHARTTPGYGADDLRALLTVAQLACAIAITIVGMLVWSYTRTGVQPLHHGASGRYVAHVEGSQAHAAQLLASVAANGDVEAESIASAGALLGIGKVGKVLSNCGQCFRANMLTPLFPVETQQHVVGTHFFQAAGIPLRYGREFNDGAGDDRAVIISESFARAAFDEALPLGKEILPDGMRGPAYEVIGIVADVPAVGLHTLEPEGGALSALTPIKGIPAIYFSARAHPPVAYDIVVHATHPVALAGITFEPLARTFDRAQAPQQWFSRVVVLLGMLLCAAALVSVFITIMLNIESHRAEIAVRRALGARRRHIVLLVYRAAARLIFRAAIGGLLLSFALARAVEVFVPGLPAFELRIALGVCALFALTTCVAAAPPLRAALRIAPAQVE